MIESICIYTDMTHLLSITKYATSSKNPITPFTFHMSWADQKAIQYQKRQALMQQSGIRDGLKFD